jgi:Ni/Fe-hydrogenase subunit HybB-like protein
MSPASHARPVRGVPFWTRGSVVLALGATLGATFAAQRIFGGLSTVTHLDDQSPWGLWIALDVAGGVALAAGGFTTCFLALVLDRRRYLPFVRPALLSALLGYVFVVVGLLLDLGRPAAIWHPIAWPQPESVLFEVAVCVMAYLLVLLLEFLPALHDRFPEGPTLPRALHVLEGPLSLLFRLSERFLRRTLGLLALLGIVLSCAHQSSLGAILLIAPSKMHPLWFSPALPILFLLSAVAVGFPVVILESLLSARAFGFRPDMDRLADLARFVPVTLGLYLAVRALDLLVRARPSVEDLCTGRGAFFGVELLLGGVLPLLLLLSRRVRMRPGILFLASLLTVLGVLLHRFDTFVVAWMPPFAVTPYVPAFGEIAVTFGLFCSLILAWRAGVFLFPVLGEGKTP